MRNLIIIYFSLNLFLSCNSNSVDLSQLEGYWEIKEVLLNNGEKRDYTINNTVEFIALETDSSGFRKKLKPKFDGTFETSDKQETIEIKTENGKMFIHYSTPMMQWKEEIINLNEDVLELENERSIRYIYNRYKPFEELP